MILARRACTCPAGPGAAVAGSTLGTVTALRWLTNGRLRDGRLVDLSVDGDGTIAEVADHDPARAHGPGEDLRGWLVLTAPAEPHAHLDKALTADLALNPTGDLMGAIQAWTDFAPSITAEGIRERARRAIEQSLARGLTAIRSHVNVNPEIGVVAAEAMVDVRGAVAGVVDLQLVALHGMQITGVEGAGNRAALAKAIELGIDVVGGCPHLDRDPPGQIDIVLDAAEEAGLPLDLHVDETLDPGMLTLEVLARRCSTVASPIPSRPATASASACRRRRCSAGWAGSWPRPASRWWPSPRPTSTSRAGAT